MGPPTATARALAARLRAAREAAGLSGVQLASALGPGWSQSKVSKIETGGQIPAAAEVALWAKATGLDPAPLLGLRGKAEYVAESDQLAGAGGGLALQAAIGALQTSCTYLAEYQPALIPGLLQIPAYIRGRLAAYDEDAEDGFAANEIGPFIAAMVRRASILYEGSRRIVHVLGEAALRARIGTQDDDTMRQQLAHLAELATLPGHEFGIVPFTSPSPIEPGSGFCVYDADLVVIETLGGDLQINDPAEVARYTRRVERLLDVAVTGSDAADFCRRLAADL